MEIGKYILDKYKVPLINKDGSIRRDKNNHIVLRRLHGVDEFKELFSVVSKNTSQNNNNNEPTRDINNPRNNNDNNVPFN